ncbi:transcription initiation factor IIE subunit beta-like [Oppia nitens]|uniref:transcription initiation factor IIE subunit beta-like n=1 Tax=Oppia nitens TaxID=1686743 RepID=UPI0023DA0360|nr:transcription initiation factor IIE subunit beta-like [Oppia nitens]
MDPALLREREAFKRKAFANPVVENKARKESAKESSSGPSASKRPKIKKESSNVTNRDIYSLARTSSTSSHNFAVLAKIVNWMKQRYLDGDAEALSFDDLLDETNQLDLTPKQKNWLLTEALPNNPKIIITEEKNYAFKPLYPLKDKKSLIRLLDKYDQRGLGGVSLEDVQESLPAADRAVKQLADINKIIIVNRPMDKKKILFYNDTSMDLKVDEDFQKLWRSVAVEGIDEMKIEEYLQNQGITSMQDMGLKKSGHVQKRKKTANKRKGNFKKLNDHMQDILEDYTDKKP